MMVATAREGVDDRASSFLQSDFWGDFKAEYGWRPIRIRLAATGSSAPLHVLVRRLGAGLSFAYVPHGPELEPVDQSRAAFLAELSASLGPYLPKGCLFIRFDPPWYELEAIQSEGESVATARASGIARPIIGPPLRRAASDVQPPDTVFVDLGPSEDGILAAMKAKWRYNVRLAEKKGVAVEDAGIEGIPEFYELYRTTSARDKIALHPRGYYERLFSLAAERRAAGIGGYPDLRLWIARHEGRALAAIVTLFRGGDAVYLYGASSDEKRNLMPAYALQWAAMRAAKSAGCRRYDLFGIPPSDDPSHPMAGLYRFKTGFGGVIAHRAGSWDLPLRPAAYAGFRALESARRWWFKDFLKRLRKPARAASAPHAS
jgi:lipid II:glycine glycyltransferase (peptidoglycan interpeptide bridge formation enzyme)